MKKILATAGLALAAALAAGPALAQGRLDASEMLARADSNGDGAVSRSELITQRESAFGRLDRNGDGFFTSEDASRRRRQSGGERAEQIQAAFDTDGDGRVSRQEFVSGPTVGFDFADTNGDDVVDPAEMAAARDKAAAAAASR